MSFQNNMAKESYPYKIIWSGYAPSSSHKIFKSCTTPMTSQAIVSYFWCSQTFSTFTQYMSVSHGYSTIGGTEYDDGGCVEKTKKGESLTSMWLINGLWRCLSIDVNARSRDCHAMDALRAISVWKLKLQTKWVCIQLACSWRPQAFEEAHHRNIQAKFYNENSH